MTEFSDEKVRPVELDDPYFAWVDCTMVIAIPPDELEAYRRGMHILLVVSSIVAFGVLFGTGFFASF